MKNVIAILFALSAGIAVAAYPVVRPGETVSLDTAGCGSVVQRIAADFADGAFVIAAQQPASIRAAETTAALMDSL